MKYDLVLELVDNDQKFGSFKKQIVSLSKEAKNKIDEFGIIKANSNKTWTQIIRDYAEFVDDLERYINELHNSKDYKPKGYIRSFANLVKDTRYDEWLKQIGYKGNFINAAEIAKVVYKFFTSDKYIRNNLNQIDNNLLNQTNNRLRTLLSSQPSVKTRS